MGLCVIALREGRREGERIEVEIVIQTNGFFQCIAGCSRYLLVTELFPKEDAFVFTTVLLSHMQ